ncbi:MAG: hypothetical protein ACRDP6_10230 [Actinoallomurus sp.]
MARTMYDAAYPPQNPPPWDVAAGYIGGDTPHVWTAAEWASQSARWRLPIFVRSNPGSRGVSATEDAALTIAWLRSNGVARGRAVALDLETAVNPPYVRAYDTALVAAGYVVLAYGSVSTVYLNPKTSGGYWAAHYTGKEHQEPRAVATQWANDRQLGKPWDASTIDDSVPLWDTTNPSQEDDMAQVSSLGVDGKQVIKAADHADVKFSKEFTDKHGLHADDNGASVVIAPAAYWVHADAIFELHGLTPGTTVDVAWTRVKDDGTFIDDAWRLTFTADDKGVIRDELGGQFGLDATNRLRLRVYNPAAVPVTVQGCMAKASLFSY